MIYIEKENFNTFMIELENDSDIRFVFYLFDFYPFLKRKFDFFTLKNFLKNKKNIYGENYFLLVEAEIVFGEYYTDDPFFEKILKESENLSSEEKIKFLKEIMKEYIEKVVGFKLKKLLEIIDGPSDAENFIRIKCDFLEMDELEFKDLNDILFGFNYKKNNYINFGDMS